MQSLWIFAVFVYLMWHPTSTPITGLNHHSVSSVDFSVDSTLNQTFADGNGTIVFRTLSDLEHIWSVKLTDMAKKTITRSHNVHSSKFVRRE